MNIKVKYYGPTTYRGLRYIITNENGKRKSYPYDYSARNPVLAAVEKYCFDTRQKWTTCINFRETYYFTCIDSKF